MPATRPVRSSGVLTCALALVGVVALAACGGGSAATLPATAGAAPALPLTTVVLTADVDLDGVNDLLEIPLDATPPTEAGGSDGRARCWRGRADGTFAAAGDGHEFPGVDAIRNDLRQRPDHDILADEGAHRAPVAGTDAIPYAVLHLERGTTNAPDRTLGAPLIDGLQPSSARAGALVGIEGIDLAAHGQDTSVQFDELEGRVLLALPRFVLVIVPDRAPLGALDLVVTRGVATSRPMTFTVVDAPTPTLDSVAPDPLVPGVFAILRGRFLGTPIDDVEVTFGGVSATRVLPLGSKVFVEVPALAASGQVIVTVNGTASNAVVAEVASVLDTPTLTRVTPAAASPGSLVRIAGTDLFVIGQRPKVTFGTKTALAFGYERGAIIAIVPTGADGDIKVTVGGRTSNGLAFELLKRGAPTISALSPDSGSAGKTIDIEGADLYDLSGLGPNALPSSLRGRLPRVTFGELRSWFVFPIVGGLRAVVPFGARAGRADVVVTLGDAKSDPATFTVK